VASEWIGGWARCAYDAGAAGGAPQGEIRPISNFAPSTGTITIDSGTAYASGDEYELWKFPDPSLVLDFLDQILKQDVFLPTWAILTNVPDGDMEQSATTDWDTVSNATVAKTSVTTFGVGKRYLAITPSQAAGYSRSLAINVKPGDTYHLSALVQIATAGQTARVALYSSAGTLIDYIDHTALYPARVEKNIAIPSGVDSVHIRLIGQATTDVINVDEVCFYSLHDSSIPLPWWLKNRQQLQAIFKLRNNMLGNNLSAPNYQGSIRHGYDVIDDAFGRGTLRVARFPNIEGPLVIFGTRNEEAFANDHSDAKLADENFLVACLAWRIFSHLRQQPSVGLLDSSWVKEEALRWEQKYYAEQRLQIVRLEELFAQPNNWGFYR